MLNFAFGENRGMSLERFLLSVLCAKGEKWTEATEWYEKAPLADISPTMINLGDIYKNGYGGAGLQESYGLVYASNSARRHSRDEPNSWPVLGRPRCRL